MSGCTLQSIQLKGKSFDDLDEPMATSHRPLEGRHLAATRLQYATVGIVRYHVLDI